MASFRVELPLPPTANSAYPTNFRTRRRYLSPTARAWKVEAGWMIRAANPPKIRGPYTFMILVPLKARGDADGYVKLPQDLLSPGKPANPGLGVTPDDRHCQDSRGKRDPSVPWRRCIVILESV